MKKRKFLKKILPVNIALAIMLSMLNGTTVFAANNENNVVSIVNEDVDRILFDDLVEQNTVLSCEDFYEKDVISNRFKVNELSNPIMTLDSAGDKYESNNGIATATTGLMNKKVTATIHEATDVDWYTFEVVDTTQPYSFVLMNIPTGCDYDLALFNSDLEGYAAFQEGNTTEEFYININEPGTYYVAVQSYSGFSASAYTLYFGTAYKTGSTGWRNSGLEFNFGYIPQGNNYYTNVSPQYYNLTNDSTIPNGSVMTSLYIDNNGNGGTWGGFYKYIMEPSGYGMEQIGNLQAFNVPDMTYYVKQNWQIWGKVLYSYNFVWEPQILIGYKFIVTPQTMGYVS